MAAMIMNLFMAEPSLQEVPGATAGATVNVTAVTGLSIRSQTWRYRRRIQKRSRKAPNAAAHAGRNRFGRLAMFTAMHRPS
jgi:hypothetical protein